MKKKVIDFDLLCNTAKMPKKTEQHPRHETDAYLKADDNAEILRLLHQRLKLGYTRYGHGLRVDDDTRKYGTQSNDWVEMGTEEILDNLVYLATAMVRHQRDKRLGYDSRKTQDDCIVDEHNKRYLKFTRN